MLGLSFVNRLIRACRLSNVTPVGPCNNLEKVLGSLHRQEESFSAFYTSLLQHKVYILASASEQSSGEGEADTQYVSIKELQCNGDRVIPIFTSLFKLRAFIRDNESYISLHGRDIIEALSGEVSRLRINPGASDQVDVSYDELKASLAELQLSSPPL